MVHIEQCAQHPSPLRGPHLPLRHKPAPPPILTVGQFLRRVMPTPAIGPLHMLSLPPRTLFLLFSTQLTASHLNPNITSPRAISLTSKLGPDPDSASLSEEWWRYWINGSPSLPPLSLFLFFCLSHQILHSGRDYICTWSQMDSKHSITLGL